MNNREASTMLKIDEADRSGDLNKVNFDFCVLFAGIYLFFSVFVRFWLHCGKIANNCKSMS